MRYLGLDLGTRTLGLAISDVTETIATSYKTLRFEENNYDSIIEPLRTIIEEENIKALVLGLPKNMNNTLGDRSVTTIEVKEKLENNLNIPIYMQDERLSTVAAHNYMLQADISRKKRKNKVDSLAASIILQSYLDKKKGE